MKIEREEKKIERGMKGDDVERLQKELKKLGYDPGPIDGKFGPKTEAAIKEFQKKKKLEEDGIVDPKTAKAINAALRPPVVDLGRQEAKLDLIKKIYQLLNDAYREMDEKQEKEFRMLKRRMVKLLFKKLEMDLDLLEYEMAEYGKQLPPSQEPMVEY